jgi:uncharacterized membrane protein YoaK (UPF0700 family)
VSDSRRRDRLLIALTFSAGAVDAVALIALNVFTAVMTGNIVLLGVALGHGTAQNALRSLVALAAYAGGVVVGARLAGPARDALRPAQLARALAFQWLLQAAFFGGWIVTGAQPDAAATAALIVLSGLAMGVQATTTRSLAPGMSTTYVTGTVTALLSELSALGAVGPSAFRRAIIVVSLAAGAVTGALTLTVAPLLAPAVPLVVIGLAAAAALRSPRPSGGSAAGGAAPSP